MGRENQGAAYVDADVFIVPDDHSGRGEFQRLGHVDGLAEPDVRRFPGGTNGGRRRDVIGDAKSGLALRPTTVVEVRPGPIGVRLVSRVSPSRGGVGRTGDQHLRLGSGQGIDEKQKACEHGQTV